MLDEWIHKESITLNKEIQSLRNERDYLAFENNQLKTQLKEKEQEQDQTFSELQFKKRRIHELLCVLDEKYDQLREIHRDCSNAKAEINRLEKSTNNEYVSALLTQIDGLKNEINGNHDEIDKFNIQIKQQQATIKSFEWELEEIKAKATNEIQFKLQTIDQQKAEVGQVIQKYEAQFQLRMGACQQESSKDKQLIGELTNQITQIQLEFAKTKDSMEKICNKEITRMNQQQQKEANEFQASVEQLKRENASLAQSKKNIEQDYSQLKEQFHQLQHKNHRLQLLLDAMNDEEKCFIQDYQVRWARNIKKVKELYDYITLIEEDYEEDEYHTSDEESCSDYSSDIDDSSNGEESDDEQEVERRKKLRS